MHNMWMYKTKCSVCHLATLQCLHFASFLSAQHCVFLLLVSPLTLYQSFWLSVLAFILNQRFFNLLTFNPGLWIILLPLIQHAFGSSSFFLLRPQVLILPLATFSLWFQTPSCSAPNLWSQLPTAWLGFPISPHTSSPGLQGISRALWNQ